MCAVCWTGAQIIPVSAVAGRYVWVNHVRGWRRASEAETEDLEPAKADDDKPVSV
jgi:hypothetical protein